MPDYTPNQWANVLLRRLKIQPTGANTRALVGWVNAEGGNWHNDARYNPLNTTQNMPGAGNTGSQGNIKVYQNWNQGLDATVKTLKNGKYGPILQALKGRDPMAVGRAIEASPWGTGGLALKTIQSAQGHPAQVDDAASSAATAAVSAPTASPDASSGVSKLIDVIAQMNKSQDAYKMPDTSSVDRGTMANPTGVLSFTQQMTQKLKEQQDQSMEMIKALSKAPADTSEDTYSARKGAETQAGGDGSVASGTGSDAALSWAEGHLGFKETGTNAGGIASYLNKQFGMQSQPWCAMFTSAAVTKGGAPASARTASVAQVRAKAAAGQGYHKGVFSGKQAQRGDLIMWGDNHIAMVESVTNGKINYIGGNQSNGVTKGSTSAGSVDAVRPLYGRR
jgi:hypothetical protein